MFDLYDIYDNELLIKKVTEMSYSFIDLIEENKINHDIDNTDSLQFIKDFIKNSSVNFSKSNTTKDSCKTYILDGYIMSKFTTIELENCLNLVTVLEIKI